jgi:hypothetical protein
MHESEEDDLEEQHNGANDDELSKPAVMNLGNNISCCCHG